MVRFAARHEYARTVEDVLARRCRLLFLDAALAATLAAPVAKILREETGADPQANVFLALARQYRHLPGQGTDTTANTGADARSLKICHNRGLRAKKREEKAEIISQIGCAEGPIQARSFEDLSEPGWCRRRVQD